MTVLIIPMQNLTNEVDVNGIFLITFVVEIILIFPTVLGNGLILYCIRTNKTLHSKSFILIANLASLDLLFGIIFIPFDMATYLIPETRRNKISCLLRNGFAIFLVGASALDLLLMSADRYLAISNPLLHLQFAKKNLVVLISLCWILAAIVAILPLLGWNSWKPTVKCVNNWFGAFDFRY